MKCTPRWTLKISAYIAYLQKKATPTSYPSLSTLTLSSGPSWRDPPVSKFRARGWALGMSACWISHSSYYSINGGKVDLINQLPARASPFLFMTEATSMTQTSIIYSFVTYKFSTMRLFFIFLFNKSGESHLSPSRHRARQIDARFFAS